MGENHEGDLFFFVGIFFIIAVIVLIILPIIVGWAEIIKIIERGLQK